MIPKVINLNLSFNGSTVKIKDIERIKTINTWLMPDKEDGNTAIE